MVVVQRCSVNNALKKNYVIFTGKHTYVGVSFLLKITVFFSLLVLQVIPSEATIYKSYSEKFSKSNTKTIVMKFSFIEVGDCNFTIKELHQIYFPVNIDIGFL